MNRKAEGNFVRIASAMYIPTVLASGTAKHC